MTHSSGQLCRVALLTLYNPANRYAWITVCRRCPAPAGKDTAVRYRAVSGGCPCRRRRARLLRVSRTESSAARWPCWLPLCALLSFGPQKYFDAQFHLIWPAVIAGQAASAAVITCAFRPVRGNEQLS
jgi:hypothetical protein